jgi:hypothetical protein
LNRSPRSVNAKRRSLAAATNTLEARGPSAGLFWPPHAETAITIPAPTKVRHHKDNRAPTDLFNPIFATALKLSTYLLLTDEGQNLYLFQI